jgi:hypothetical protein
MFELNRVAGFCSQSVSAFSRSSLSKISCIASRRKFSTRGSVSLFSRGSGVFVYYSNLSKNLKLTILDLFLSLIKRNSPMSLMTVVVWTLFAS